MSTDNYWDHQTAALLEALLAPAIAEFLNGKTAAEVAQAAGDGFAEFAAASPASPSRTECAWWRSAPESVLAPPPTARPGAE